MNGFSRRTAWDRTPNPLSLKSAALSPSALVDLTENNPTRVGLVHPAPVVAAFQQAPLFPYQPEPLGLPTARAAVARYLGTNASQVALTASTSEAYGALFKLLCDPGDNVLVPRPGYPLVEVLAQLEGVQTRGYPSLHDVEALADERTRAVVLIQPWQPTGAWVPEEELEALAALAARRGWALVSDEVFVPRAQLPSRSVLARPCPTLTFALSGLSKVVGLPQAKLAWMALAGPAAPVHEALARLELLLDSYLSVSTPVQHAASELLAHADAFQRAVEQRVGGNEQLLRAARPPDASWSLMPRDAGWSVALRLPDSWDEERLALALLERGVKVAPGHWYDFPRGKFVVLSLLVEPPLLAKGLHAAFAKRKAPPP